MRIYESFNTKFNTYKNLEEKFQNMKLNFENKERFNDYDPQKFMKNPKIEEQFENRKFAMVEYRKSVHARSKSQLKPGHNQANSSKNHNSNLNYNNNNNSNNKFHQVSNLDENPNVKKPQMNLNDPFYFGDHDNSAISDFNKIDNNFANLNLKGNAISNENKISRLNNKFTNIPTPNPNEFNNTANKFNIKNNLLDFGNAGANVPVKIKDTGTSVSLNNNDFNEIFGNPNYMNSSNNVSNINNAIFPNLRNNPSHNPNQNRFEFNFDNNNNNININHEDPSDFVFSNSDNAAQKHNQFNPPGMSNNNFDFPQSDKNINMNFNHNININNNISNINNINHINGLNQIFNSPNAITQSSPGINNIGNSNILFFFTILFKLKKY